MKVCIMLGNQKHKPVDYAYALWDDYVSRKKRKYRAKQGQFSTPPEIARYMASLASIETSSIKVLDPGAGTGILSAALVEAISKDETINHIAFKLYETEEDLCQNLEIVFDYLEEWASSRGTSIEYEISQADFILENEAVYDSVSKLTGQRIPRFDFVIMNPPYFKISKSDRRAKAASSIVYGQPNIYALFLMLGALMLDDFGTMISISPRSFASGLYYRRFRKRFFEVVHPSLVHLFASRKKTFKASNVLQETVIMKTVRGSGEDVTNVASSSGIEDLQSPSILSVPTKRILRKSDGKVLFLPMSEKDLDIMETVEAWPETLSGLGLKVSTGPVVPFRATEFLHDNPENGNHVPLLWMQNVRMMKTKWPRDIEKPQYILDSPRSRKLLLPSSAYVLIHRFSAKEQERRFIAAPISPSDFRYERIGIENHLNYVHKPSTALTYPQCVGLAAILCTNLLDKYIRIRSGHTQINSSDMKSLPLPEMKVISKIGNLILNAEIIKPNEIEAIVLERLDLEEYMHSSA